MIITKALLPAQERFIHIDDDVTLDIAIYQGGYGAGKTWIGSLLGILLCQKYPGIVGLCLAKTYPMVRDTTLRTYLEHLDHFGLQAKRDYTYNQTKGQIIFHCWGESEILYRHLQSPEKIKSLNVGFVQIEECSQITESEFQMCLSRLRQAGIPRYRFFGHTNPQPNKGWIWQTFVAKNKGKVVNSDGTITQYRRIIAPSSDNCYLPTTYLENMKNQFDPEYYRINVLGEDGDYNAGLVCPGWSEANIQEIPYDERRRIYLSCDFNVDPLCWSLAYRINGEYHFFDELCLENSNIVTGVQKLAEIYRDHTAGITITGDASGRSRNVQAYEENYTSYKVMMKTMSDCGFYNFQLDTPVANPLIHKRIESWNALICNVDNVRRIKVDPCCTQIVHILNNIKYIPGSTQIWQPTPKQIEQDNKMKFLRDDMFDSISYLTYRYDPIGAPTDDDKKKTKMKMQKYRPTR